jgi:chemotaxis response regulator CheB
LANLAPVISDTPDETDETRRLPFNVVGLGASAGGIEAYIELLEHLRPDTGMAYVVVLHLLADQKSHLREILARHTEMPVEEIEDGIRIQANRVYVTPPKFLFALKAAHFGWKLWIRANGPLITFLFAGGGSEKPRDRSSALRHGFRWRSRPASH